MHNLVMLSNRNSIRAESEKFKRDFPSLFKGIGKLKKTHVQLHIERSVRPMAQQRHRCTPFHPRNKVERELEKLLTKGIIEKVEEGNLLPGSVLLL